MRSRIVSAVIILVAALIPPLLMTAPASAASTSVNCGVSRRDVDNGSTFVTNRESGFSGPAMRTGPGFNCPLQTRPPWGSIVYLGCYRIGDAYNGVSSWSAVVYGGYFGFINDNFLYVGSGYPC
jgi:hypothetical protein